MIEIVVEFHSIGGPVDTHQTRTKCLHHKLHKNAKKYLSIDLIEFLFDRFVGKLFSQSNEFPFSFDTIFYRK